MELFLLHTPFYFQVVVVEQVMVVVEQVILVL
jgi:hypothetical protein